jgi:hypothetical protein
VGLHERFGPRAARSLGVVVLASMLLGGCVGLTMAAPSDVGTGSSTGSSAQHPTGVPTGLSEAPERPESLADGSAPPAADPPNDPLDNGQLNPIDRVAAARLPSPAPAPATPPSGDSRTTVPVGGRVGLTPGQGTQPSQPTGAGFVDTLVENRLPGTPGWKTTRSGPGRRVEGFADATSVTAGDDVRVFVSSTASTFRIQLLRVGWYGGVGARSAWLSDRSSQPQAAKWRRAPE